MISGILTALLMILFIGVAVWAYSARQKPRFREAEMLPLIEDTRATKEDQA
ncbi:MULTISPECIES: CcoQ/FixQ family Cbb3-type cytochrome c oxidase assembly chaperone [Oleiagrimonas]|jgi:cytochrome c oxidase cbb3-type subunit IV|uniref:CcoQ/FixQ family Cbb3-type cytochrome c oxidase assembly chaperone n=1 Tax=Oleiagrimonas citrea TaxID=1665687 RepID=A0A846ZH64_9GAMM|nr:MULTISPECIES: CcoQ/FixQ family Cbb3-type cytochrome c oxidase assembly chaperone [Oleiagrimonas]NKZ37854.1 CcoQ/FixQ family Cbb3-type cytochrome c oxidase assembly chaperone [Oleiagrimonas citrea]RAP57359.1 cytochrome-c oxidase [Oleiagrimonas sp. MCCC 1A03011]